MEDEALSVKEKRDEFAGAAPSQPRSRRAPRASESISSFPPAPEPLDLTPTGSSFVGKKVLKCSLAAPMLLPGQSSRTAGNKQRLRDQFLLLFSRETLKAPAPVLPRRNHYQCRAVIVFSVITVTAALA